MKEIVFNSFSVLCPVCVRLETRVDRRVCCATVEERRMAKGLTVVVVLVQQVAGSDIVLSEKNEVSRK